MDRQTHLARALGALSRLAPDETPARETLADLRYGWGNRFWAAKSAYLEAVAHHAARTRGPVLECGSGATTLLLAGLAARRGAEVWVLEHSEDWLRTVADTIAHHGLPPVHLRLCPLQDYGAFSWYRPPLSELPKDFRLIICDGPPGTTRGGRYGLFPVLGAHMSAGAIVLLDDANRWGERTIIQRWHTETGATAAIHGRFAVLTLPG